MLDNSNGRNNSDSIGLRKRMILELDNALVFSPMDTSIKASTGDWSLHHLQIDVL